MALALADELRDFDIRPAGTNDIAGAFRLECTMILARL